MIEKEVFFAEEKNVSRLLAGDDELEAILC
jgi:hypothetical protein